MKALANGHLPEVGPTGTRVYSRCGEELSASTDVTALVGMPMADVCRECRLVRSGWVTTFIVQRSPIHDATWVPYQNYGGAEEIFLHAGPLRAVRREVERRGGPGRWHRDGPDRWAFEEKSSA